MPQPDPANEYLRRLRGWRTAPDKDLSLGFLRKQFEREVARPMKQLGKLADLWQELVPAELVGHTRLEGLARGVLKVAVDSSSHLYELDRLLRSGLERQLVTGQQGPALRRVQLRVAGCEAPEKAQDTEEG